MNANVIRPILGWLGRWPRRFQSTHVKVNNDGPKTAYIPFKSSSPTTGDYALSSGDSFTITAIMADTLSVIATSPGGSVRVLALR